MKLTLIAAIASVLLFSACTEKTGNPNDITLLNGGKTYGGELVFSFSEPVTELFPLVGTNQNVVNIASQVYESLLNFDLKTLKVTPNIASSFSMNENGDIYSFEIRSGIYFHDDACFGGKGRELTAEDVKYSLDFACSGNQLNGDNNLLLENIKGAVAYNSASKNTFPKGGVSGIKVNGNVVTIELNKPQIGFEALVARKNIVMFAKEAYDKYGKDIVLHPVGTGPFKLEKMDANSLRLIRNDNYWQKDAMGNKLPYLNAISVKYFKEKKAEMMAFRNKEIDLLLEIPADEIEYVLGSLQEAVEGKNLKHKVESSQSLNIEYVGFNTHSGIFSSKELREAIYFAVDPSYLVENYISGDGYAPTNGFVPEIEGAYNSQIIPSTNPEKARALLAKAGYPNGANFPATDIYVNAVEGSKIHAVMTGFVQMIQKELNIELRLKLVSFAEREKAIASGQAKIWRSGWVADYPSPASFLELFYAGVDKTNKFGYNNEDFNINFQAAMVEKDPQKRGFHYIKAQSRILEDAVVVPLLIDNMLMMVNARVKGVAANQMELLNLKEVYIKEPRIEQDKEE